MDVVLLVDDRDYVWSDNVSDAMRCGTAQPYCKGIGFVYVFFYGDGMMVDGAFRCHA